MDPRREDVLALSCGHAHQDAFPSDMKTALLLDVHQVTANRYKNGDKSSPYYRFLTYFDKATDMFRLLAYLHSRAIQKTLTKLSKSDLIALYHETLRAEPQIECDDRTLDMTSGACWLNRSRASERDSTINARKSAIEREFAVRQMTDSEVWAR